MAERLIAAVLKTADCNRSGGSNPSFSARRKSKKIKACRTNVLRAFFMLFNVDVTFSIGLFEILFSWIGEIASVPISFESGFSGCRGLMITSSILVGRLFLKGYFISRFFAAVMRHRRKEAKKVIRYE